jgi:predicted Zn-dependent protease
MVGVVAVTMAAMLIGASNAAAKNPELGPNEIKLGQEAVAEAAKTYKLGTSEADLKRIRAIGAKLAQAANTQTVVAVYGVDTITKFDYAFDIIEEKDINAFCVPGGHIYVYRGLLDFVQSDDELAAILAHETTHAAHHHMVFLLKKQAALDNAEAIAMLATIMSGAKGSDVFNVAQGIQLLNIAKINGYGMQAERDADAGAVRYMMSAGYNPVGLLTFMERLARQPEYVDLGIYRNHPLDADRVKATRDLLTKLKVPIDRRAVTNSTKATVTAGKTGGAPSSGNAILGPGADSPGVLLSDKVIYRPAAIEGKTSQHLAQEAADKINAALDSNPKIFEIKADAAAGAVTARDKVLFKVSDADAKLMGVTPGQAAQAAATVIKNVILMQMVDTVH